MIRRLLRKSKSSARIVSWLGLKIPHSLNLRVGNLHLPPLGNEAPLRIRGCGLVARRRRRARSVLMIIRIGRLLVGGDGILREFGE